jgi:GMP synthase-like glutamine amidotransferase
MRAHYLQHVPFEGLGSIEPWLKSSGYEITCTRLYAAEALPSLQDIALLIVMGGPMSVNDEADYPWLVSETAFIQDAIQADKAVLGICLGAQLIAKALGARVYRNPVKEIGWLPVMRQGIDDRSIDDFAEAVDVFHWHGETFDLPPGAIRLASSRGCENQAFQIGGTVVGLQFHLETTPESAMEIVQSCRNELVPSEYVQSETEILNAPPEQYRTVNDLMDGILCRLVRIDD